MTTRRIKVTLTVREEVAESFRWDEKAVERVVEIVAHAGEVALLLPNVGMAMERIAEGALAERLAPEVEPEPVAYAASEEG